MYRMLAQNVDLVRQIAALRVEGLTWKQIDDWMDLDQYGVRSIKVAIAFKRLARIV